MLSPLFTLLSILAAPAINPGAGPVIQLDPCAGGNADASATLGADVDFRVLNSGGIAYASGRGCNRFVADFTVPSNANPADNHGILTYDMGGGFTSTPSQAACAASALEVTTYEKAAGSNTFVKRTTAKYKGVWGSGLFQSCNFQKTSGQNPGTDTPNAAGTEVWRVTVRATHNGVAKPVTARIGFQIVPW